MPYKSFSMHELSEKFGISNKRALIFNNISTVKISQRLQDDIDDSSLFSLTSEKAKSEAIIFPIMSEIKRNNKDKISIFSGERLDVDEKMGLNGECDFIISKNSNSFEVESPIITVIEAKKDNSELGIAQCSAQMIGSKFFNEKRNHPIVPLYGCVTNADNWQFLMLKDNIITIDIKKYYLNKLDELLGVFQFIIESYSYDLV